MSGHGNKRSRKQEQGDTTVLPVLRTYLDQAPGFWEQQGTWPK
jgi:hypothetical protein